MICLAAFVLPLTAWADIVLSPIFGDNMVFQQAMPLTIWGQAEPGEKIAAFLGDKEIGTVTADSQGHWKVKGQSPKAGPLPDLVLKGHNTVILKNLLAGEVWLCSGQSNMLMTVTASPEVAYGGVINSGHEVRMADHPGIRFFKDKWEVCSPETIESASAAAYFFGRSLHQTLNVPVGLVTRAVGGSAIEFWVGEQAWTPELREKAVDAYRPFYQARKELNEELSVQLSTGDRKPPRLPTAPEKYSQGFSKLYLSHIAPLAGFPLRGVLWYQGETNTLRSGAYVELLTALIQSWRNAWDQPDLPFVIIQLTNFAAPPVKGDGMENWPVIRAGQAQVAATVPHVVLASTLGAGDPGNLHPRNKQEIGRRAALRALDVFYHQSVPRPPAVRGADWTDSGVILTFADAAGGLLVKGDGPPFFELAGVDGIYHSAQVAVSGETVTVSSEKVRVPVRVRYAWLNNPSAFLYNADALAVAPFELEK